ncbi:hypothetical protein BJ944DRAFT_291634 [Cunninghamella echinulata]|nr:hypothetical protein BJ944DRAFT_291634 [Cunninghamella echinulata]
MLCTYIWNESDLKEIQYLWIDAISVDQQNHERKKETILKMSEIYKKAAYILAVPDLHFRYLWNNPANKEILELIEKYNEVIYEEIRNKDESEKIIIEEKSKSEKKTYQLLKYFTLDHLSANGKKNEELKRAYGFLAFLVFDWWNRAWVVSEYQIAKEKYKKQGTPLKYIFISLLYPGIHTFFSYSFDDSQYKNINSGSYTNITYYSVDCSSNFMPFLISRFIQRDHLNLLLESNATKNEDRFHAILPSWTKYSHLIEDKSTISNWNITDITSVRLKLYEIMDDLWDKAKLLHACSVIINLPILPSYASQFDTTCLYLYEKEDIDQAYDAYSSELSKLAIKTFGNDNFVRQYLLDNKKGYGLSLYTENLTYIQLKVRHLCLCIKANKYFINTAKPIIDQDFLSAYSLKNDDGLRYAFIPFFTFTMTGLIDSLPMCSSNVFLLGNIDQNRWILYSKRILNEED